MAEVIINAAILFQPLMANLRLQKTTLKKINSIIGHRNLVGLNNIVTKLDALKIRHA
jgi:hypothetical protein